MLFLLLTNSSFFAQKNDSILKEGTREVYESPDSAISKGMAVFNSSESSTADKINALMLVSTGYSSKREYEKSLEFAIKTESYFSGLKDNTLKINILNKIGTQYQQLDIYDKAIEYFDEALRLTDFFPNKDSIASLLGYNYAARGFIYREQMSCDIALNYFDKAIEQYKKTMENQVMNANLSIIEYNKGNCFITLKQIGSAKTSFQDAIDFAQVLDAKSLIAFAKKGLAEVNTLEGNYENAIDILKEAEKISDGVGDLILNQGIYKALSDNYLATNDWEKYGSYHDKYTTTIQDIEETERNAVNQSIDNLMTEKSNEITALKSFYLPLQIGIILLIIVCLIGLNIIIKKSSKKLGIAKNKLQTLKNDRSK